MNGPASADCPRFAFRGLHSCCVRDSRALMRVIPRFAVGCMLGEELFFVSEVCGCFFWWASFEVCLMLVEVFPALLQTCFIPIVSIPSSFNQVIVDVDVVTMDDSRFIRLLMGIENLQGNLNMKRKAISDEKVNHTSSEINRTIAVQPVVLQCLLDRPPSLITPSFPAVVLWNA